MSSSSPRAGLDRANRAALTLLGLVLLAAGVVALCLSYRVFGTANSHRALLTSSTRRYVHRNGGWLWPTVIAVAIVLTLLGLRWLSRQSATSTLRRYQPPLPQPDTLTVHGSALTDALCAEITSYHGVHSTTGSFTGHPRNPQLRLRVQLEPDTDSASLLRRITSDALVHARQATGIDNLPIHVQLTTSTGSRSRVQ